MEEFKKIAFFNHLIFKDEKLSSYIIERVKGIYSDEMNENKREQVQWSEIQCLQYERNMNCNQLCTVVLSFLPYTTGKQQLEGKMPKIRHLHFINRSQRDNISAMADFKGSVRKYWAFLRAFVYEANLFCYRRRIGVENIFVEGLKENYITNFQVQLKVTSIITLPKDAEGSGLHSISMLTFQSRHSILKDLMACRHGLGHL